MPFWAPYRALPSVVVHGSIVTATGGSSNAAGIGHGPTYSAQSVTITDGINSVTATRGSSNSGVRCIGDKMNGSATIDGKSMSKYFEGNWGEGAPTFNNLILTVSGGDDDNDYKNATTWTLTHK